MKDGQLGKLSIKQLNDLKTRIDRIIAAKQESERDDLKAKFAQMAAQAGFSLGDIVRTAGSRSTKGRKVAPKYANPSDRTQTWAGRGRMPRWMTAKLKGGAKMDDFRI